MRRLGGAGRGPCLGGQQHRPVRAPRRPPDADLLAVIRWRGGAAGAPVGRPWGARSTTSRPAICSSPTRRIIRSTSPSSAATTEGLAWLGRLRDLDDQPAVIACPTTFGHVLCRHDLGGRFVAKCLLEPKHRGPHRCPETALRGQRLGGRLDLIVLHHLGRHRCGSSSASHESINDTTGVWRLASCCVRRSTIFPAHAARSGYVPVISPYSPLKAR